MWNFHGFFVCSSEFLGVSGVDPKSRINFRGRYFNFMGEFLSKRVQPLEIAKSNNTFKIFYQFVLKKVTIIHKKGEYTAYPLP